MILLTCILYLIKSVAYTKAKIYVSSEPYSDKSDGSLMNPFSDLQNTIINLSTKVEEIIILKKIVVDKAITMRDVKLSLSSYGGEKCLLILKNSGYFDIEAAQIVISNISLVIEKDFTNVVAIRAYKSNCEIQYSEIRDLLIPGLIISLIMATECELILSNLQFYNLYLNGRNILTVNGCYDNDKCALVIDNCFFSFIESRGAPFSPSLFIKDGSISVLFIRNQIKNITTSSYFLHVSGTRGTTELISNNFVNISTSNNYLLFTELQDIILENNTCLKFNNDGFNEGGSFLFSRNSMRINVIRLVLQDFRSTYTTVGIKIIDSSNDINLVNVFDYDTSQEKYLIIKECSFKSINSYYEKNYESGGVLFIASPSPVIITNSSFQSINLNSSQWADEKVGGPCVLSLSKINTMNITSCSFIDNHSRFSSNGITFFGIVLFVKSCIFKNNNPIFDPSLANFSTSQIYSENFRSIMDLHVEVGGALLTLAEQATIADCIFSENGGYSGGAMFINAKSEQPYLIFKMNNCIFRRNIGGISGGAIKFFSDFQGLDALINCSAFEENDAYYGGAVSTLYSIEKCLKQENCFLILNNTLFYSNYADHGGAVDAMNFKTNLTIMNSIFFSNIAMKKNKQIGLASIVRLQHSILTSYKNKYLCNFVLKKGGFFGGGDIFEEESIFISNSGLDSSTYYMGSNSHIYLNNVSFINEYCANLGIITVGELTLISIRGTLFKNCSGNRAGLFIILERANLRVSDSVFIDNYADTSSILKSFENYDDLGNHPSLIFYSCVFHNTFSASAASFDISNSKLFLLNCTFYNSKQNIFYLEQSYFVVIGVKLFGLLCTSTIPGCIVLAKKGTLIAFSNFQIENVTNSVEGAGFYVEDSILGMIDLSMTSVVSANTKGSCLVSRQSKILVSTSRFELFNGNCFDSFRTHLAIEASSFQFNHQRPSIQYMEAVIMSDSNTFMSLNSSLFSYNSFSNKGGVLNIFNSEKSNLSNNIFISDSKFVSNSALEEGGVMNIIEVNISIFRCLFNNNSAARGGAIFFFTSESSLVTLDLRGNHFLGNKASKEGGAIKVTNNIPDISMNEFKSNAAPYGSDLASYPCYLSINISRGTFNLADTLISKVENISDISSGNTIPYNITVFLVDSQGAIVNNIDDKVIQVGFLSKEEVALFGLSEWDRSGLQLLSKSAVLVKGVARFNFFTIISNPNSSVYLKFHTEAIYRFYYEFIKESKNERAYGGEYMRLIKFDIRDCILGEIYINFTNTCWKCPKGRYSISLPRNSTCKLCPEGAFCSGGTAIEPFKGFWRSSENSSLVHNCKEFSERCLGEKIQNCETGYTGRLCSNCEVSPQKKFSRLGVNLCKECQDIALNLSLLIVVFLLFGIVIYLLVNDYHKEANKIIRTASKKKKLSYNARSFEFSKHFSNYLKILINYYQLTSIISSMDLKWPLYVQTYLSFQINMGSFSVQLLSLECLILNFVEFESKTGILYFKVLAGTLIPFSLIILFFLGMQIANLFKRKTYMLTHFLITFLVVNYLLQPTVLKELTKLITCEDFETVRILSANKDIDCESEEHKNWLYRFVIPATAYWVLLYPGLCFFYLFKNRARIDDPSILMKFGFFLESYKKPYFFWEFYIMLRKIIVIFVASHLNVSILAKATLLMVVCSVSSILTFNQEPFLVWNHNYLEFKANLSSFFIIYAGVFYLSIENNLAKAVIFLMLIAIEINFLYLWVISVLKAFFALNKQKFKKYFPFIIQIWAAWNEALLSIDNIEASFLRRNLIFLQNFISYYLKFRREKILIDLRTMTVALSQSTGI